MEGEEEVKKRLSHPANMKFNGLKPIVKGIQRNGGYRVVKQILLTICVILGVTWALHGYAQQAPVVQGRPQGTNYLGPQSPQPPATVPGNMMPGSPGTVQTVPVQTEVLQKATPEQRKAIEEAGKDKGDLLTPEALEALRVKPEFQGLKPGDIVQGKETLEKKGSAKVAGAGPEKRIPGGEKGEQSNFERARAIGRYQEISTSLKPFGYDFFQDAAVRIIMDRKDIPVPTDYVIGPGDEVKILLWGRVSANYNLTVDRNGNITIPQVGPVPVAGLTFEQMSKHLIKQADQIVGANIDVTMGALKSIPIFVLGDVRRPGAYTIGSFATMTDALLVAGGPSDIGTMRSVQLRRKDKIITTFDFYDLLLKGDKSKDTMLQAGDVVFVPVQGPLVGVAGNVKRPAIYELRGKYDLETLFDLAGGIIPTAYTQQIQIERIVRNERQVVVDVDDRHLKKAKDTRLQDMDLVKVFNIVEKEANTVFLTGNVKKAGKYEYKKGMKIRDLLKDKGDLLSETAMDYALLVRIEPPAFERRLIPFNLEAVLSSGDPAKDFELQPQDHVYVFSKWFFRDRPYITVEGEVRNARTGISERRGPLEGDDPMGGPRKREQVGGENRVKIDLSQNMRVRDAILMAGDVTRDAYLRKGEMLRIDRNRDYSRIYFDVGKAMAGDPESNLLLQDEDRIVVHSIYEFEYKKSVSIDGDVLKPGDYQYLQGLTVKDLVFAAGNIRESAYLDEAEITSQIVEDDKTVKSERRGINLKRALRGDPVDNVVLKPYDRVTVKRLQDWRREQFATVGGEVKFPGRYATRKKERLSSLIERAGGYSDDAYLRGAVFTRVRVRDLQQKGIDEMVTRMEKELLSETSTVDSGSSEGVQAKQVEVVQRQRFIETLRKAKPTGRLTVYLANLRLLKGSDYDIELEAGDELYIPTKSSVVNVAGAVMVNGTFTYGDTLAYEDYVKMAGGYTRYADTSNIFVMKVDGSARKMSSGAVNWNPFRKRWEAAGYGEGRSAIEAGDSIVVPEKLERTAWLRELKDITQIFANVGLAASTVAVLYKTLKNN